MRLAPEEAATAGATAPHATTGAARLAEAALVQTGYSALNGVVSTEYGGVIRLGGSVPSQYLKQVAFAAVCQVVGAHPVRNEIRVVPTTDARSVRAASCAASGWFNVGPHPPKG